MPILNKTPESAPVAKPPEIRVTSPEYKGVAVDTRYTPMGSILSHIGGAKWIVEYYKQVVDQDSELQGQSLNKDAVFQQYDLIHALELRVQTDLNIAQNAESASLAVTGAATVPAALTPNYGDMFTADIGDGREGVFMVTLSEKRSHRKDVVHQIEYQLVYYTDDKKFHDLRSKTVKEYHFSKDFAYYNQNPIVEEDDYVHMRRLSARRIEITQEWFRMFFSREYQTVLVPAQEKRTVYDHFVARAIRRMTEITEAPEMQYMRELNITGDDCMRSVTIWDALCNQDIHLMNYANRKVGLVLAKQFTRDAMLESFYHCGIQYAVYPADPELTVDYQVKPRVKVPSPWKLVQGDARMGSLRDMVKEPDLFGLPYENVPLVPDAAALAQDDFYVFSEAFYEDAEQGQSKLELCVWDYLRGKPVDIKLLVAFTKAYHSWGALERFYYAPVLIILINSVIRGM